MNFYDVCVSSARPAAPLEIPLRHMLKGAHVFDLSDDVVRESRRLIDDIGLRRISEFAQLPHPVVFLEWNGALGRELHMGTALGLDGPKCGALLFDPRLVTESWQKTYFAKNKVITRFVIQLFEPLRRGTLGLPVPTIFMPHVDQLDIHCQLASIFCDVPLASSIAKTTYEEYEKNGSGSFKPESERGTWAWDAEVLHWMYSSAAALCSAAVVAINCKNLTKVSVRNSTPWSRNTPRTDITPLSRNVVTIGLSRVQTRRLGGGSATAATQRLHTVRRHFKVRKTGVFWWSAYWRGSADAGPAGGGSVTKSYKV